MRVNGRCRPGNGNVTSRMPMTMHTSELYARARARVPVKVRLHGGHISERAPARTTWVMLATLGLYGPVWLYRLGHELRETTALDEIRPARDVALTCLTLGLYGVVILRRYARAVHAVSVYFERSHADRSNEVLTFAVGGVFSFGLLTLGAMRILDAQMNELGALAEARVRERARLAERASERRIAVPPSSGRGALRTEARPLEEAG